jgi:hypothetical protein
MKGSGMKEKRMGKGGWSSLMDEFRKVFLDLMYSLGKKIINEFFFFFYLFMFIYIFF